MVWYRADPAFGLFGKLTIALRDNVSGGKGIGQDCFFDAPGMTY